MCTCGCVIGGCYCECVIVDVLFWVYYCECVIVEVLLGCIILRVLLSVCCLGVIEGVHLWVR